VKVVLVTGGSGFIGANLVRRLLEDGWSVRILDNLSSSDADHITSLDVEFIEGDILDTDAVKRAVKGCSALVHLAARAAVLESVVDPFPSFETNARGTLVTLRQAVDAGVTSYVLASTNAVLGEHEPPLSESHVPRPVSPYGASKLAAEAYCASFSASYGLCTVALRFSNVYGPFSAHKTSVISKFMLRLMRGEPLTIYGDGKQTRDFIFVLDIVDAIAASLEPNVGSDIFQVGTGRETDVLQLVDLLADVVGVEPEIEHLPSQAGEVRRNYVSIKKANEILRWKPQVALSHGLEQTYKWLAANVHSLKGA
jgi:UDP-glucose 4-epimerase